MLHVSIFDPTDHNKTIWQMIKHMTEKYFVSEILKSLVPQV